MTRIFRICWDDFINGYIISGWPLSLSFFGAWRLCPRQYLNASTPVIDLITSLYSSLVETRSRTFRANPPSRKPLTKGNMAQANFTIRNSTETQVFTSTTVLWYLVPILRVGIRGWATHLPVCSTNTNFLSSKTHECLLVRPLHWKYRTSSYSHLGGNWCWNAGLWRRHDRSAWAISAWSYPAYLWGTGYSLDILWPAIIIGAPLERRNLVILASHYREMMW